jgi:polysaccharide deacetylase 2 family uncharacterized protein YibQ
MKAMKLNELKIRAKAVIDDAWNSGYSAAQIACASKLRVIAAEVNVSADQLRAEIEAEAARLEKLGRKESAGTRIHGCG